MSNSVFHIDLGGTSYYPNEHLTGIPRVTLSLSKAMSNLGKYRDIDLSLISLLHNQNNVPTEVLNKFNLKDINQDLATTSGYIFLLDIYYFKFNFLNKLPSNVRNNFTVIDYIHDIIPVTRKNLFDISEFKFKNLIRQSFMFSDGIITPSRTVVDEIVNYITSDPSLQVGEYLKLGYNYHGADFSNYSHVRSSQDLGNQPNRPYFLMVGTLEVRKNHLFVLEAFEKLWSQGAEISLCIAGKIGWKVAPVVEKLGNHPERNKRLFFIDTPTDAELSQLYSNAFCLIFASIDEGFGLPVIEASHHKTPLLLSDIPIFREIAQNHARYFSLENSSFLVEAILDFCRDYENATMQEDSSNIKAITWLQSATNLLDNVIDDKWYCTIHKDKSVEYNV